MPGKHPPFPPPQVYACIGVGETAATCAKEACWNGLGCQDPNTSCQYVTAPFPPCEDHRFQPDEDDDADFDDDDTVQTKAVPVTPAVQTSAVQPIIPQLIPQTTALIGPPQTAQTGPIFSTGNYVIGSFGALTLIAVLVAAFIAIQHKRRQCRAESETSSEKPLDIESYAKDASTDLEQMPQPRGSLRIGGFVDDFFDDVSSTRISSANGRDSVAISDSPCCNGYPALVPLDGPQQRVVCGILELEAAIKRLNDNTTPITAGWDEESVNTGVSVGTETVKLYNLR
ncbi:hypothetical protein HDU79_005366 [Rhizoclosmatium sp. JEL0117]|nr:hypothetical protein HDU79_005366 [Rhizoclosmatium sp. JEL0117]